MMESNTVPKQKCRRKLREPFCFLSAAGDLTIAWTQCGCSMQVPRAYPLRHPHTLAVQCGTGALDVG